MWILIVVRLAMSNEDMVMAQEFHSRLACETAGLWITQHEPEMYKRIEWTCIQDK